MDYNIIVARIKKPFKLRNILLPCLLLIGLTGCVLPANPVNTPTFASPATVELPTNTQVILVDLTTPTLELTSTSTQFQPLIPVDTLPPTNEVPDLESPEVGLPTVDLPSDESTPQPTATTAHKYPAPMIMIESPGPLSKLVTPILLQGSFNPGEDGMLYVELFSTEGTLVGRQVLDFRKMSYTKAYVTDSIPFDIDAAGAFARLVVSTHDKAERVSAIASVDLILLQMGANILTPPSVLEEPYVIQSPKPDEVIKGGVARVYGVFKPINNSPLLFELKGPSGETLGYASFLFSPLTADQGYATFVVDITYNVLDATAVRLSIYQNSDNRIPGVVWLTSEKLILAP
jgi:hypothetical protein